MSLKTYSGSCHCGSVRYEADLDLAAGTTRCNCSICSKGRAWFAFAKGAAALRLVSGTETLGEYRFAPPGRPAPFLTHCFCNRCGIRVFAKGGPLPELGGTFYGVHVMTLDNVETDELAAAPIRYQDMRHDRFDRVPADTRLM